MSLIKRKPKENSALNRKTKSEKILYSIFFVILSIKSGPITVLLLNSVQQRGDLQFLSYNASKEAI